MLLIFYIIPEKARHIWLLAASYFFYMCWNVKYVLLLFSSTVLTYISGILIEKISGGGKDGNKTVRMKKTVLAVCAVLNFGLLFIFKYFNFAADAVSSLLSVFGAAITPPSFDIVLPVGISFYTFQAMGYAIDVYRGDIKAEKNFLRYALFVSFFPQLVAGPIERSGSLLRQLSAPRKFSFQNAEEGYLLILWGYFLKIVIADRLAVFVDSIYGEYASYPGVYLIAATLFFAVQIYCDFAGYSVIAAGGAKMLGVELTDNFDAPYLSGSLSEFWKRWHISLTRWFRDYLYIPLGGNRRGKVRKYFNQMLVFIVSGLWHGAELSFVVWGALNGAVQVLENVTAGLRKSTAKKIHLREDNVVLKIFRRAGTFIVVDFLWIFFRAGNITEAFGIIRSVFTVHNYSAVFDGSLLLCGLDGKNMILVVICIIILAAVDICRYKKTDMRRLVLNRSIPVKCVFFAVAAGLIMLFGKWGPVFNENNFIYFQF